VPTEFEKPAAIALAPNAKCSLTADNKVTMDPAGTLTNSGANIPIDTMVCLDQADMKLRQAGSCAMPF
jgi:hypothetical protein